MKMQRPEEKKYAGGKITVNFTKEELARLDKILADRGKRREVRGNV